MYTQSAAGPQEHLQACGEVSGQGGLACSGLLLRTHGSFSSQWPLFLMFLWTLKQWLGHSVPDSVYCCELRDP